MARRSCKLALVLAASASSLFAAASPSAAIAGTPACPRAFGSISRVPPGCWRPYGPDAPVNRQIPDSPVVSSHSGSIIANLAANHIHFAGGGSIFAYTSGGRDGVYFSAPSDPLVTIHCTFYWGLGTCTGANGVAIDGQQIRIPSGAQPQEGLDHHMTVIDQSNNIEYDFEHATWSSDHRTLNVYSGASATIGPTTGTGLGGGGTAAGMTTISGLITEPQLASGTINHALVASIPCTDGYIYPARRANGLPCSQMRTYSTTGVTPQLGALLQLDMTDAQIAATHAPAWEKTLMTAMAHYGIYVNDTSGNGDPDTIELESQSDISYTSMGRRPAMADYLKSLGAGYYAPLNRWILSGPPLPVTRLRVIDPCFLQGTCPARSPQARAALRRRHRAHARRSARARRRMAIRRAHRGAFRHSSLGPHPVDVARNG